MQTQLSPLSSVVVDCDDNMQTSPVLCRVLTAPGSRHRTAVARFGARVVKPETLLLVEVYELRFKCGR